LFLQFFETAKLKGKFTRGITKR